MADLVECIDKGRCSSSKKNLFTHVMNGRLFVTSRNTC